MGHAVDYIVVNKRDEVWKAAEAFAFYNTDRQENPSGTYHGNMTIHDNVICEDYKQAYDKIQQWDDGWYSDHAVQFRDTDAMKPTKAVEALMAKASKISADKKDYIEKHSLKERKSEFIGCKKCGSKLANKYLKGNRCPVCGEDLRAEYIVKRIEKYNKDYNDALDKVRELKKKQAGKCPVRWLVKVEVHC